MRNRRGRFEAAAEKSHGRLLVRKACSIFDPGGQKSQPWRAACEIFNNGGVDPRGAVI